MILRNKKTGEIINSKEVLTDEFIIDIFSKDFDYFMSKLDEIQEEWEAVQESLIKDEKIRKAVRAWAEALGTDEVRYNSCAEYSEGRFEAEMGMADIDFGRALELKDGNYTIAELCGEGEDER